MPRLHGRRVEVRGAPGAAVDVRAAADLARAEDPGDRAGGEHGVAHGRRRRARRAEDDAAAAAEVDGGDAQAAVEVARQPLERARQVGDVAGGGPPAAQDGGPQGGAARRETGRDQRRRRCGERPGGARGAARGAAQQRARPGRPARRVGARGPGAAGAGRRARGLLPRGGDARGRLRPPPRREHGRHDRARRGAHERVAVAQVPAAGVRQPGQQRPQPGLAQDAAAAEDEDVRAPCEGSRADHGDVPEPFARQTRLTATDAREEDPPMSTTAAPEETPAPPGLKQDALGFVSSCVIGVASTAPGYSLAASLGLVVAIGGVGLQAPAVLLVAFIPMLLIASAYYYMNRADPDCGTTFAWVTKALGPWAGWLGGWAIIVADVIVMANLAQIAGLYSFLLVGWDAAAASTFAVTLVGVIWIGIMTWICLVGIELSARTQVGLLGAEIITLFLFAVFALVKVASGDAGPESVTFSADWLNPFAIDSVDALVSGVLVAVFIYWGWDSTVTVNEESQNSNEGPGRAALTATVILLLVYVIVAVAAQSYGGTQQLIDNADDVLSVLGEEVFGSPWDKILIVAVLTSAAASTQTTILPTARTSLSMARVRAMPAALGHIHPRYLTPDVATLLMGGLSIVWYVGLTIVSENILFDSIAALGLMIAFYYGITGIACAVYYRHELTRSVKTFLLIGVGPTLGGICLLAIFVKSCWDLSKPENSESGDSWFGLGPPLVIGLGFLVLGAVLMVIWSLQNPAFFRRKPEVADPALLDGSA